MELAGPEQVRDSAPSVGLGDAGSPIVGAFGVGAALWRKGATRPRPRRARRLFRKNLVAIRAELRYALTIYYAGAFAIVDVTGS